MPAAHDEARVTTTAIPLSIQMGRPRRTAEQAVASCQPPSFADMFIRHLLAATTLSALAGCARTAPAPAPAADERPRLVVLVVVDQLREPLLGRYDDLFTGGLGGCSTRAASTHARRTTSRAP